MKKFKAIIIIILSFLILYFLQINFFTWFTIRGVMPNLFIGLTLFIGLFAGRKLGGILGVIFGIILDFLLSKSIGFSGIFLGIIGLLGEYFDKNFSKDNLLTIILMIVGSTILYEIGIYIVSIMKYGASIEIDSFIFIISIETIYNVLITIILYPLVKKVGYYIEDICKGKRILTRYF